MSSRVLVLTVRIFTWILFLKNAFGWLEESSLRSFKSSSWLNYQPDPVFLKQIQEMSDAISGGTHSSNDLAFHGLEAPFFDTVVPSNRVITRAGLVNGLLTFGTTDEPPLKMMPTLRVRQLPVSLILNNQSKGVLTTNMLNTKGVEPAGALSFGPPPDNGRPRRAPPEPIAVRVRLEEATSDTPIRGASSTLTRLHGPVALGSGGVGYARLPNGAIVIGSGGVAYARFTVPILPRRYS